MLKANNRTYTFVDERTRNQIDYISGYYLEHTTKTLKAAWQKTLEETGVNPFPQGFLSTLSQLAVEKDFATGGNDDIFGDDLESNIADEKTFYAALLNNLT